MSSKVNEAKALPSRTGALAAFLGFGAIALCLLFAPSAGAANPPSFEPPPKVPALHATRAFVESGNLDSNGAPVTEGRVEYSTSESKLAAGEGAVGYPCAVPGCGLSANIGVELNQLEPSTHYYARFYAANEAGSSTEPFQFTTPAPEAPQLGALQVPEIEGLSGEGKQLGPTYVSFQAFEFKEVLEESRKTPAGIESNGAETSYRFEYTPKSAATCEPPIAETGCSWQPFTEAAAGTITVAQEAASPTTKLTGLSPETSYYARLRATNSVGSSQLVEPFETTPASPGVDERPQLFNAASTSASASVGLHTRGYETHWRFEYASSESGPWSPGPAGTIAAVPPAQLFASEQDFRADATLTGLSPASPYFVRVHLDNGHGEATSVPGSVRTAGPPSELSTFDLRAIHGESLRALGSLVPNTEPVSEIQTVAISGEPSGGDFTLSFEGQTTAPLPFDARATSVQNALVALPNVGTTMFHVTGELETRVSPNLVVEGQRGGPYTIRFASFGGPLAGKDLPQLSCDSSGLSGSGLSCGVTTDQSGLVYHNRYFFEYVSQEDFEAPGPNGGFAQATSAPALELGSVGGGENTKAATVGEDLPALSPGLTYHYRLAARNDTDPAEPLVHGPEQTLTVPVAPEPEPAEPCPNEALRTGPAAHLPDCRAYELISPPEKGASAPIDTYPGGLEKYEVGEDGNHFLAHLPGVNWGASPDSSRDNYLFSREEGKGWRMTSLTPQPQAGIFSYEPILFSPDLTQTALQVQWQTTEASGSPETALELGPPGGPYQTIASIPKALDPHGDDLLAAASADFSKLIVRTEDRTLAGRSTHTTSGNDLYEYSEGVLRQANVDSSGHTLGTCGAGLAKGIEGTTTEFSVLASPHAVSADGSRVFFSASAPGKCASPNELERGGPNANLYLRSEGAETLDIGAYRFLEADATGSALLLEAGGQRFRYDTAARSAEPVPAGERLEHPRYSYEIAPAQSWEFGTKATLSANQMLRTDNATHTVECISCASPFNSEPRWGVRALIEHHQSPQGVPEPAFASADGRFAFFETISPLLPADDNGEAPPEFAGRESSLQQSSSTDVYEWRAAGVDGCAALGGCIALITGGGPGVKNTLIGATPSGHDVFIATHEALLPSLDQDTAGDIYDVRIGGGFPPPPPRPVECEGDACQASPPAPIDQTPASLAFSGPGNPQAPAAPIAKTKPKLKAKPCGKSKSPGKRRCAKQRKRSRSVRAVRRGGRGGHR